LYGVIDGILKIGQNRWYAQSVELGAMRRVSDHCNWIMVALSQAPDDSRRSVPVCADNQYLHVHLFSKKLSSGE
jgi:hypothetical protein